MDKGKILKSSQEQAVASWIAYLNQVRLNNLFIGLQQENMNLQNAMETLDSALNTIKEDIIDKNRGGATGMHGYIAEVAEKGFGNAQQLIRGDNEIYRWVNDNSAVDLIREGVDIQQKFYQSGGHLSLDAVKEHLSKYPDFIENGGKYQIPKDQYERLLKYLSMSEKQASRLSKGDGELSYRQWKWVKEFFDENDGITPRDIEGSILEYKEAQARNIEGTFKDEKSELKKINEEHKRTLEKEHAPSIGEMGGIAVRAAAIEGSVSIVQAVMNKRKNGRQIKDFEKEDWIEVLGAGGKGSIKGGIRGITIYSMTNYLSTPSAVASSITTAAITAAEQIHLYRLGEIDASKLTENIEAVCIESSVSAVSSLIGQTVIPVPVIGAVIGNTIGTTMYSIAKEYREEERLLIEKYIQSSVILDKKLNDEYQEYLDSLTKSMEAYIEILQMAFHPDPAKALDGSIELSRKLGLRESEILHNMDEIDDFFLN